MTSISAPTSLATFSQPHASSSKTPHVSLAPVIGREGLAVAAVQGDGVWTYDLATLRPSTTFTVPPSTVFSTAPISFYPSSRYPSKSGKQKAEDRAEVFEDQEDSRAERITAMGVLIGEQVRADEEGRVVWVWKGEEGVKSSILLEYRVQAVHHVPHHRAAIVCVGAEGQITALDSALQTRPVPIDQLPSPVVASQIISFRNTMVQIALLSESGEARVVEIDISGPREISGKVLRQGQVVEQSKFLRISSAEISPDGTVDVYLTGRKDVFLSRSIKALGSDEKIVHSPGLRYPLSTAAPLPLPVPGRPVSLLAIKEPEPSLLLVSSLGEVTAVLTVSSLTSIVSVPDAAVSHLSLVSSPAPGSFTVALTLSYKSESVSRTAIHTVEVALPSNGVGMNLLIGSQAGTKAYFHPQGLLSVKSSAFDPFFDAFAGDLASGNGLSSFEAYIKGQESASASAGKSAAAYKMPEHQVKNIIWLILDSASKRVDPGAVDQGRKILSSLIKRKWVNDDMYPEGVLNALIKLKDWDNACRAVRTIPTVPSSAVVNLIKYAITFDKANGLGNVLRDVLATATPDPDYRNALRQVLSVEEATRVLEVLDKWLLAHVEKRSETLAGWTDISPKTPKPREPHNVPSLQALINHASSLLDSHLPLFLAYRASWDTLESIQSSLDPLIAVQETYRKLRAPVEAVLTLSRREARKAEEAEARREVVRANTNGGVAKTKQSARVGIPPEAIGKWKVEEFVF